MGGPWRSQLPRLLGRLLAGRRRRAGVALVAAVLLVAATIGAAALGAQGGPVAGAVSGIKTLPTPPPSAVTPAHRPSRAPAAPAPTGQAGTAPSSEGGRSGAPPGWHDMPQRIADIVSQFVADQGAAGAAVAVSTGTGATTRARYITTQGEAAAGTPWTAETRSAYRSITKSFVGTVVLQLVGEGKLGLDDPIARYMPGLASVQFDGVPAGDRITVREALDMRTGVPEFSATRDFSDRLDADYSGAFTDDGLLAYAFAEPLDFAPGSQYEYSNTNFVLLGKVIQAVTGTTWNQEVASRILGPLGFASIGYSGTSAPAPPVATPYQTGDAGLDSLSQVSPSLYGASGGYFGDIGDLLAWGRALGSGSLVTAGLQQERLTPLSSPRYEEPGSPDYDGYGLAAGSIDGWWGHTGTGLGYEALTLYNPKTGTTVAVLINTQLPNPNGPAVLFRELEGSLADLG